MANRKINWNKKALRQFDKAINYIANKSLKNAGKVRTDILKKIDTLVYHPEVHSPDRFKKNNNGNYRAFELHRYRNPYFIANEEIRILRIRHTSMEPEEY